MMNTKNYAIFLILDLTIFLWKQNSRKFSVGENLCPFFINIETMNVFGLFNRFF